MGISANEFAAIAQKVRDAGYGGDIEWSENVGLPGNARDFAQEAIFVICNSGMRFTVAQGIYSRVMAAIKDSASAATVFGHKGKSAAIDFIWQNRDELYLDYLVCGTIEKQLEFCASLPWIGQITKYHLAKNFGADVAKPDVHLQRLADSEGVTAQALCERLAKQTGYRVATVDVVLWRACAIGIINSRQIATPSPHKED